MDTLFTHEYYNEIKTDPNLIAGKTDFGKEFTKYRLNNPSKTHAQCRKNFHELCNLGTLPTTTKENPMYGQAKMNTTATNIGPISMNVDATPINPEDKARDHLLNRVERAAAEKKEPLLRAFGLQDDDSPRSLKDFFARINAGKYIIPTDEKALTREYWGLSDVVDEIRWRDPAVKEDQAGFDAAVKAVRKAQNDAADEIIVKTPVEGLQVFRDFQAKTFN